MKICTRCKIEKPESEFCIRKGGCGRRGQCLSCDREKFKIFRKLNGGVLNSRIQTWKKNHPDKVQAQQKEWNESNREVKFAHHLKRKYGLSLEQYDERILNQGGVCAICEGEERRGHRLCVDHIHDGQFPVTVRGLLCHTCNAAIGLLYERPELFDRAKDYLQKGGE